MKTIILMLAVSVFCTIRAENDIIYIDNIEEALEYALNDSTYDYVAVLKHISSVDNIEPIDLVKWLIMEYGKLAEYNQ